MIGAAAFLELSSDDSVDPDDAVGALEDIAATLQLASADEVAAIRDVCDELIAEEISSLARCDVIRFYENFLESVGLVGERAAI